MMKALLLLSLLMGICLAKPVEKFHKKHWKGWSDRLETEEWRDIGSGRYYENDIDEPVDSEPDADVEYEELLPRHGSCVHPETKHSIAVGSFDFNYESCLLCQCPNGKLKCSHTC